MISGRVNRSTRSLKTDWQLSLRYSLQNVHATAFTSEGLPDFFWSWFFHFLKWLEAYLIANAVDDIKIKCKLYSDPIILLDFMSTKRWVFLSPNGVDFLSISQIVLKKRMVSRHILNISKWVIRTPGERWWRIFKVLFWPMISYWYE